MDVAVVARRNPNLHRPAAGLAGREKVTEVSRKELECYADAMNEESDPEIGADVEGFPGIVLTGEAARQARLRDALIGLAVVLVLLTMAALGLYLKRSKYGCQRHN
jgi:hypothetical protein